MNQVYSIKTYQLIVGCKTGATFTARKADGKN